MIGYRNWSKGLLSGLLLVVGCVGGSDLGTQTDGGGATAVEITGPAPDLVETTVGDPPATVAIGGSFTASDTVTNQGSADAGASYTKYYLSSGGTVPEYLLGNRAVGAIVVGGTDSGTGAATVPAGVPQGSYKVIACADSGSGAGGRISQVTESNENNNCSPSAGSVTVNGADLSESNVTVSPSSINASTGTLTVTDTVNNTGTADAGASVTRWFLSTDNVKDPSDAYIRNCNNGGPIPGRSVGTISAGGASTGSASTTPLCVRDANGLHPPASGTYYVIACADSTNVVAETNESNNCAASSNTVTVAPNVDLIESAVGNPSIATGQVGSTFTISDTVQNTGGDPAPSSYTKFYFATTGLNIQYWLGTRSVAALSTLQTDSATTTLTIQSGTPAGTYHVVACADSGPGSSGRTSQIAETNENNNCTASVGTVTIGGLPDLVITAMTAPPANGSVGTQFSVTATTANQGVSDSPSFYNKFYLSANGTLPIYLLAPGALAGALTAGTNEPVTTTATVPSGTAAGTYWVLGCADAGPGVSGKFSQVQESNENNNCTKSPSQIVIQ